MYLWIALEALSPEIKSQPNCGKCQALLNCPKCGPAADVPRVIKSIETYLASRVKRKVINHHYKLRCQMVHGRIPADAHSAKQLSSDVMSLMVIALEAIKNELGWARAEEPSLRLDGTTHDSISVSTELVIKNVAARLEPLLIKLTQVTAHVAPHK
jgi:hypothetical protein